MRPRERTVGARDMIVELTGVTLIGGGLAIAMLPEDVRQQFERASAIAVAVGVALGLLVLKLRSRTQDFIEQDLAASEQRMRFAQDVARMGSWDTDLATGAGIWSAGLRELWGIDDTMAATFDNFLALLDPDEQERVASIVRPVEDNGGDFEYEYRLRRPDGELRWFLCRGRIVLGEHGRPARSLGVAMDISDRKRADEERASLEQQLRQAQKLQAIGRLAGSVAHDFNNLLLAIRGYGELAQNALRRGEDVSDEISEIVGVADRAAELTGQLLAFSRKQILRPQTLDLNDVVGEMQKLLCVLVGERVDLELAPAQQSVSVDADRSQLEQVIVNLAVNARDAMPDGGRLRIAIGTAELGNEHGLDGKSSLHAVLTVSDTGCGMDAETSAQIFEPFFSTKDEGTGLGLATVHGIVTQSGGSVWVYSEVGQGTTFKIYLPLVAGAGRIVARASNGRAVDGGSGETILLIEDDAQVRGIVASMLEERGYRVLSAANGEDAVAAAQRHSCIDLVLSDVVVAGESGPDIARSAVRLHPEARVLHMSGYTDDTVIRRGVIDRDAAFIEKPFSADELASRVRRMLTAP